MATILLIIIYLAFISLGLPDSMMGAAWPAVQVELALPLSTEGLMSIVCTVGTIISSLFSAKAIRKFGTGWVTAVSVFLTAAAIFGVSFTNSLWWLLCMMIPLGMGAGAVDSALNNYVALHYKASHMNFLHSFWGIGVTVSPLILSFAMTYLNGWRSGYKIIAVIQAVLVAILIISVPLWKKERDNFEKKGEVSFKPLSVKESFRIKGAVYACAAFACYCGVEFTCGHWGASFLVGVKGLSAASAAKWVSAFYLGITLGRLLCGFIAMKINSETLIRVGESVMIIGGVILALPLKGYYAIVGLLLVGLGCAPVFPNMLHLTPKRFGEENSQSVMGIQMACAYVGGVIISPLFGLIGQYLSISLYPYYLLIFAVALLVISEVIRKKTA